MIFGDKVLRIVWPVEVFSIRVFSWASMVPSDNEVRRAEVLSDNCMPYRFPRACHAHSKGKKCKMAHTIGVFSHDSFIHTHTGIVIDITRLGKTDDRVDEDISLPLTGSTDGEFTVGSVHRVASLKGDNF